MTGEESAALWRSVRDAEFIAEPRDRAVWRVSLAPSRAAPFAAGLGETALAHFFDWGGGLVWVATAGQRNRGGGGSPRGRVGQRPRDADARAGFAARRGRGVRAAVRLRRLRLSRGLKQSFDPDGVLNFGRMYDGV